MMWCDVVWYGMVWYGMVWYDMIWYDMTWHDMTWHDMIWYDMIWYDIATEMAQQVKALAAESDNLSLLPKLHTGKKNWLLPVTPHVHHCVCVPCAPMAHTHKINENIIQNVKKQYYDIAVERRDSSGNMSSTEETLCALSAVACAGSES